jgi:hypothetical protein
VARFGFCVILFLVLARLILKASTGISYNNGLFRGEVWVLCYFIPCTYSILKASTGISYNNGLFRAGVWV